MLDVDTARVDSRIAVETACQKEAGFAMKSAAKQHADALAVLIDARKLVEN